MAETSFQEGVLGRGMLIVEAVKESIFTEIGVSNINNLWYEDRSFFGIISQLGG
jgi:hypothetical protein